MTCWTPVGCLVPWMLALAVVLPGCADDDGDDSDPVASLPVQDGWTPYPGNPIVALGELPPGEFWNDPSVLKVVDEYWMYMSTNVGPLGSSSVLPFRAISDDGVNWSLSPATAVLGAGNPGDFDAMDCETPDVVFFGGAYHMYYSGQSESGPESPIAVGHATSPDGITWTKDAANPIVSPTGNPVDWNGIHVAEPGAVVFNGEVYLYLTAAGLRPSGQPISEHVIAVTRSMDGSTFSPLTLILQQHATYPASRGFEGYSTPHAAVYNGRVHLFYDVAFYQDGTDWRQVALHHAVSADGETGWVQDAEPIFIRNSFGWTLREIRSPAVLFDGAELKLWFAGDDLLGTNQFGIGYATADIDLYE